MLQSNFLQIRDKAELRIQVGLSTMVYDVRVQDIQPDGIYIDRPIIDRRLMPVKIGGEIELEYQRADASYRFTTRILREEQLGLLHILVLEKPQQVERIQRREFFRLDVVMPVKYCYQLDDGSDNFSEVYTGTILDLSAGGIKFITDLQFAGDLRPGRKIQVTFSLESQLSIFRQDAVLLKTQLDPRREDLIVLMCRFIDIPNKVQEEIIVHNIRYQQHYRVEKEETSI